MLSPVIYVQEAIEELHHVRWPTRKQAIRLSVIVLGFCAVTSVAFGLIDFGLSWTMHFLLSLIV